MAAVASDYTARYWRQAEDGRIVCELCPRRCALRDGQHGFCFVRQAKNGALRLITYGRSTGFCVDPIEKKPLYHFLPGSAVLSFGTAGCNLGCRFCQNWNISHCRRTEGLSQIASPEAIARAAGDTGSRSVAFTYNEPTIFAEYALDTAIACRERGIATVAVTNGYISEGPREEFFRYITAANVDLKAIRESFYERLCFGHLQPVLDTLVHLARQTNVWLEVTTLLIPGQNDAEPDLAAECAWLAENLGPDVPVHFTAFHPAWRMRDVPRTPLATLQRARQIALASGLRYVYTGNVLDREGSTTRCSGCGQDLIRRDGFQVTAYCLNGARCPSCGAVLPGVFDSAGPIGSGSG